MLTNLHSTSLTTTTTNHSLIHPSLYPQVPLEINTDHQSFPALGFYDSIFNGDLARAVKEDLKTPSVTPVGGF